MLRFMTTEILREIKAQELKRGMRVARKGVIFKIQKSQDSVNAWFQGCYVAKQYQVDQVVSVVENQ